MTWLALNLMSGDVHRVRIINPFALLWFMACSSVHALRFLASYLGNKISRICLYHDGVTPGNCLRPDVGRSYDALFDSGGEHKNNLYDLIAGVRHSLAPGVAEPIAYSSGIYPAIPAPGYPRGPRVCVPDTWDACCILRGWVGGPDLQCRPTMFAWPGSLPATCPNHCVNRGARKNNKQLFCSPPEPPRRHTTGQ